MSPAATHILIAGKMPATEEGRQVVVVVGFRVTGRGLTGEEGKAKILGFLA